MGRRLAGYVIVNGEVLGPNDHVPDQVAAAITNPKAWAVEQDQPVEPEPEPEPEPARPRRSR